MIDILYDGSGGFGREIEKVSPPFPNYFTGYAGGINPDNVKKIVNMIEAVTNDSYYIDMESGIRTDDFLDLDKCNNIINSLIEMMNED